MRAFTRKAGMELSVPTLQFTDFLVFGSCGAIFVCNWWLRPQRTSFLMFGVSFLVCAAMALWFVDFGYYGSVWSPLGWSLAGLTFWIGFRLFDGKAPVTRSMIVLAILPTGVHIVLSLAGFGPESVNAGSTIAYALHEAAVARYVLGATSQRSPVRTIAGYALIAIAVAICLPLLPLPPEGLRFSIVAIFITDQVTSIVLTTCILAMEAETARAKLAAMARTDALTGTLNRYGLGSLPKFGDAPVAVIVADLDHFKLVNDRFGHAGGDEVLREFARRARDLLPAGAFLARLGGEEFAVILPGQTPNTATYLAERIRFAAGSRGVPWNGAVIAFTVSVGVAMVAGNERLEAAIDRADAALYAAKLDGRNRVRVA